MGKEARDVAGRGAAVIELRGRALPGLHDAHLHLEWLAMRSLNVELQDLTTRRQVLERVRRWSAWLPEGAWVVGRGWYNDDHRHSGVGYHTPADVHYGRAIALREQRAGVLTAAYAIHPERFVNKQPTPPALPVAAWINKPLEEVATAQ